MSAAPARSSLPVSTRCEPRTMIGRTFGDFVVSEKIGMGGAGEVFLAEQVTLGRQAVIKVMTRKGEGEEASNRFLREARMASRLDHPFVAHVYGFGSEPDGTLWIAMELVRGVSLDSVIHEGGPIPLPRFVPFVSRLCEVLSAAHEQGIVHRDIKPHNVMVLTRAGQLLPKLLDLGIARRGQDDKDTPRLDEEPKPLPDSLSSRLLEAETLQLTRQGSVVGTPHYMPPEQWLNASRADARSDIYSLSILAFQALTGKLPFAESKSLFSLSAAHARQPLPALPEGLPVALNQVLAKGAAKKPDDRYPSALAFAEAFRDAAGLSIERLDLPALDPVLLDRIVLDAPQPIAEAVALIEAAKSPRQQLDAVAATRHVLARYLALLALASRARIGPGGPSDSEKVVTLIQHLAQDRLSDDDWWALCAELLRPFALRHSLHPVPELVRAFFASDAHAAGDGAQAMETLTQLGWPAATASDKEVREALTRIVPALSSVLQKFSFICDYPLVVRHQEVERWMGTRRMRRMVEEVVEPTPSLGVPFLVDSTGLTVLTLSPLMQVFAPSGGMPEEIFFLDGNGRHGARLAALPGPFELQSDDVWPWFATSFLDVTQAQASSEQTQKPPYKGLSTFTQDDADNYYGREREAEAFANRLRTGRLLAVVGPSGSGKSSFVLAGVLPLLPAGWRAVVSRPGANPFAALAQRLAAAGIQGATDHDIGDRIAAQLGEGESLLLVIDQFEELVTLCLDARVRTAFVGALIAAAEHASGRLRVVLTLRDDFLIKVQQIGALRERLSSSLELISTPALEDLLRVVTEPAKRVGYSFDDPDLPRQMVEAVAEYPGALALLSFTASQLWELRDRQLRQMRVKTYETLGGVGGALAHHAELTLANMNEAERGLVREAFRHLVTAQGTRAVLTRSEMEEVLGSTAAALSVIEKLVSARLLVSSEMADGDRIEIIHEALIVSWPRLVDWQRQDAETARLRDALRASARQWDERGRPRGLLWRAETLAEYKVWRARYPGHLTQSEDAFATSSLRDEKRGQRIRQGLAVTAFVVLAVGMVLIFRAYREAQHRFLALREEESRLALVANHPMQALAYLRDAVEGGADNGSIRRMFSIITFLLSGAEGVIAQNPGPLTDTIAEDGARALFREDAKVMVWKKGEAAPTTFDIEKACQHGRFFAHGAQLMLGCSDGVVRLLDLASHSIVQRWTVSPADVIIDIAIEAGEHSVIVGLYLSGLSRLDLVSGKTTALLADKTFDHPTFAISPDKKTIAAFAGRSIDGLHGFATIAPGQPVRRVTLDARVTAFAFAEQSTQVVVGTSAGEIGLYDLASERWRWRKDAAAVEIRDVGFARDGEHLLSIAGTVLTSWSVAGARQWTATAEQRVLDFCWDAKGTRLFAGLFDGTLLALDPSSGDIRWQHLGHLAPVSACWVEGNRVLTSGWDGTLRAWDGDKSLDRPIADIHDARSVYGTPNGDVNAVVTNDGLYVVDAHLQVRRIAAEAIAPDAYALAAPSTAGSIAWLVNDRLRVIASDSGATLADWHLTTPISDVGIDGGRVMLQKSDGSIELRTLQGDSVVLRAEGDELFLPVGELSSAPLGLATGSNRGILRIWDLSGAPTIRSETQIGASQLFVQVTAHELRTFANDGDFERWEWNPGAPVRLSRLASGRDAIGAVSFGEPVSLLTVGGVWAEYSRDGGQLTAFSLRPLKNFSASHGAFFYIDLAGHLFRFVPPTDASLNDVQKLADQRGTYRVEDGRLMSVSRKATQ